MQSLRAQADKKAYQARMKGVLEDAENLTLLQGECARILTEGGRVSGIETTSGARYRCRAVVVATGVYLRSRTFTGPKAVEGGPAGLMAATELTGDLLDKGVRIRRFKTGYAAPGQRPYGGFFPHDRATRRRDCASFFFCEHWARLPPDELLPDLDQ